MKPLIALPLCLLLIGCAGNQDRLNLVGLGMNKAQVMEIMGRPDTSSAQTPHEYFIYSLSVDLTGEEQVRCAVGTVALLGLGVGFCSKEDDFFVRFENGLVESYGRVGDFDSTRVPEATINVNRN
jgi:hypothetical protein